LMAQELAPDAHQRHGAVELEVAPGDPEQAKTFLNAVKGDRLEAAYVVALAPGPPPGRAGALYGTSGAREDLGAQPLRARDRVLVALRRLQLMPHLPLLGACPESSERRLQSTLRRTVELQLDASGGGFHNGRTTDLGAFTTDEQQIGPTVLDSGPGGVSPKSPMRG
jgi:hypothetical protein